MPNCHEMRVGTVYACKNCGLELLVVEECKECEGEECSCTEPCTFECCGEPLYQKSAGQKSKEKE